VWLRLYDEAGNLVLLPEEAAQQQAQSAQQQLEVAQQQAQAAQQQLEAAQQQGLQQGALRQMLRILTTRFGEVPPAVEQGLQAVDLNQLEDLVEVALAVETLAQFTSQLSEG
jgi:flagellar biosynthesis/type III secretory pathway protein FliH